MAVTRHILFQTCLTSTRRLMPTAGHVLTRNVPAIVPYRAVKVFSVDTAQSLHSTAHLWSKDTSWANKGNIGYKEIKTIAEQPTGEVTIIDVREPDEVSAGMIPSAVNVPLTQFEKAFNPNGGADFQQKFAFPRPSFNDRLVFYCRSGKRSAQAVEIAKKGGWQNTRNYEGSWLDWVQHEEGSKK